MIPLIEKIKSGIVSGALIFGDLQPGKNPEHAPTVDLRFGVNLENIIMLKKRR